MSFENPTRWFNTNRPCHQSMCWNLWSICCYQEYFQLDICPNIVYHKLFMAYYHGMARFWSKTVSTPDWSQLLSLTLCSMVITISICVKKYPKKFLSQLLLLFTRLVSSDFEIIVWIFRCDSSTRISETMQSTMFYWKASCWKPTWSHQAQNVQIKLMQRQLQNTLLNVWDELSRQAMFWILFHPWAIKKFPLGLS